MNIIETHSTKNNIIGLAFFVGAIHTFPSSNKIVNRPFWTAFNMAYNGVIYGFLASLTLSVAPQSKYFLPSILFLSLIGSLFNKKTKKNQSYLF